MTTPQQPWSPAGGHGPTPYQQGAGHPPYPAQGTVPQGTGNYSTPPSQGPVWQPAPYGQHPPGQQQHQGHYGHIPGAPMPGGYQEHLPRPATVWIASVLLWLGSVIALAAGITAFVIRATMDLDPDPSIPPTMFDGLGVVLGGALALIGATAMASALVLGALTYGAFRGNNPCRWILVVLYGLALLQIVPSSIMLGSQIGDVPPLIWVLIVVNGVSAAIIVTLFLLPPTSAWYRYRSAEVERKRRLNL